MTTLQETLERAKQAAADAQAAPAALPVAQPAYAPPAGYQAPKMPSLRESVNSSGLVVDAYLSVDKEGMRVGKTMPLFDEVTVFIDFSQVQPTLNARGEIGGQVAYVRSSDGIRTDKGKDFRTELASLQQRSNPDKYIEYPGFEIPMTLIDDLLNKDKSVAFKAGTTVGFTPAERNSKVFQAFFRNTPADLETRGPVKVRLTHEKRQGAQAYGVALFELVAD